MKLCQTCCCSQLQLKTLSCENKTAFADFAILTVFKVFSQLIPSNLFRSLLCVGQQIMHDFQPWGYIRVWQVPWEFSQKYYCTPVRKGCGTLKFWCGLARLHFMLLARKIFRAHFFARLNFYVPTGAHFFFATGRRANLCYLVEFFFGFLFVSSIFDQDLLRFVFN